MNEPLNPDSSPAPASRFSRSNGNHGGTNRSGERLRWGLTGLAAILLIVMAAAAGLRPTGREAKPGAGEPLAVLGVAPGPATRPETQPAENK